MVRGAKWSQLSAEGVIFHYNQIKPNMRTFTVICIVIVAAVPALFLILDEYLILDYVLRASLGAPLSLAWILAVVFIIQDLRKSFADKLGPYTVQLFGQLQNSRYGEVPEQPPTVPYHTIAEGCKSKSEAVLIANKMVMIYDNLTDVKVKVTDRFDKEVYSLEKANHTAKIIKFTHY